jgi:L-lactate dehydrogenase (cytochrome)
MSDPIPFETVARHNRPGDAWIVINENVYDISRFPHPGGFEVLEPYLGRDATAAFLGQHNFDMLAMVEQHLVGVIDRDDEAWKQEREAAKDRTTDNDLLARRAKLTPISHILNTRDMAQVAEVVMDPPGWAYYASAADDEVTLRENEAAFGRLWLRPRVLVDVSKVDTSAELLGVPSSLPLYVTATALAKLADPEGEVAITRACAEANVPYMCPTLSSCSLEEMMSARARSQTQWFQLYVNKDRAVAKDLLQRAETGGCKAVFVTVDAPQLGRRERDMRFKAPQKSAVQKGDKQVDTSQGTSNALSSFIDPSLSWSDIEWIAGVTKLPVCLKGIQSGKDAVLAAKRGAKAIVVSNHGGRQLDYARSGVEVLIEVMAALRAAGLDRQITVFVDGGIRRGTDIFKCLAIGADGVGIGRPVLHGLAAYGEAGVVKTITMLRDEFAMCLMMMGCPTVADIEEEMVVASVLKS